VSERATTNDDRLAGPTCLSATVSRDYKVVGTAAGRVGWWLGCLSDFVKVLASWA
jgi:hypothetical protein